MSVSPDDLRAKRPWAVKLDAGRSVPFQALPESTAIDGQTTYFGEGPAGAFAIIAGDGEALLGTVVVGDTTYELRTTAPGQFALFPDVNVRFAERTQEDAEDATDLPCPPITAEKHKIGVVVMYTDQVPQFGFMNYPKLIALRAVAEMNYANRRSGVPSRLVLEHTMPTATPQASVDSDKLLEHFTGEGGEYGEFDEIHQARKQFNGDIAVLLVDALLDSKSNPRADAQHAFAVVHYKTATGSAFIFAHELGHIFGAGHDPKEVKRPYACGHAHVEPNWGTLMMADTQKKRELRWSKGSGSDDETAEDNARVLNLRAEEVSGFAESL